jgi:hypothetical protein
MQALGLDFRVYQQFWRLLGVDQFQINGIRVKYWEPDESFVNSFKAVSTPLFFLPIARFRSSVPANGADRRPKPMSDRPHDRPALSVRRRHCQPSGWPGCGGSRGAAGMGSSSRGYPA